MSQWFKPVSQKSKIGHSIYFDEPEFLGLKKEKEIIETILKNNNKKINVSLSDVIRLKLFFVDEYIKIRMNGYSKETKE